MPRSLLGFSVLWLIGCPNVKDPGFDNKHTPVDTSTDETGDADTDTDSDSDTDTGHDSDTDTAIIDSETGGETGDSGEDGFDEPGDHIDFDASEGATVDLTDASGDSNKDQDFYLITVNTTTSELGYGLRYGETRGPPSPAKKQARPFIAPRPTRAAPPPHARPGRREVLTDADIGVAYNSFLVRNDIDDDESYVTAGGTLWALGDNVEIWVDSDVPIDWDYECDGIIDVPFPDPDRDTFGFDNCDLSIVADEIDLNVVPNVRSLYGDESDIDGDGRIAVFITPILNQITTTGEDDTLASGVLPSYTEPTVDLTDYDILTNPGSDEREVVYTYAPDPAGYFNNFALVDIDSYTQYTVAAEFARGMTALVSYNQHVIVWEDDGDDSTAGTVEDDWMNDALGTFAADYCGFGAAYYPTAWQYLDAPYLFPLLAQDTNGTLERLDYGAQYLFALWVWDWATESGLDPIETFNAMMQTTDTSTTAVEAATGQSFDSLVLAWQVALLTTGVESSGSPLVDDGSLYVPYADPTTISSPPAARDNHYGANGYQSGFYIRGDNQPMNAGNTDFPTAEPAALVRTEGTDFFMYNPEFTYNGYVAADYAAQVTRLTGIPYDATTLVIDAPAPGIIGEVVRWTDPETQDWAVENVYSPTESTEIPLPELAADGSTIHGLGQLYDTRTIDVVDELGDTTSAEVYDTDLWLLDLSSRTTGEIVDVTVWLDRQFLDDGGASAPENPWIAVAPVEWVPQPTSISTYRDTTSCPDSVGFTYPTSLITYLYTQEVLSPQMYSEGEEFAACGTGSGEGSLTCDADWDNDGVSDADEPTPDTFYTQVLAAQCDYYGNALPDDVDPYSVTWMDAEEQDGDDEDATLGYSDATGGQAGDGGEEGYVHVSLTGGEQYFIVVGAAGGSEGTYEISVKQTN